MLTVLFILTLLALALAVADWFGKSTLRAAVFVLCVIELLRVLPLGR